MPHLHRPRARHADRHAAAGRCLPCPAPGAAHAGHRRGCIRFRWRSRRCRHQPLATVSRHGWGGGHARRKTRNDPIRGTAARVRAAGRPLDTQVGVLAERRAGETARWSAGSPGLGEALAWEVGKRRLRAEVGPRGNDPIRGKAVGAGVEDGARVARAVTGFGMMRGLALGGTTLARTWEPSAAKVLAGQFGPAVVVGWPGVPSGIAAMPSGGCAQRPYTRSGRPGADGGGDRVGR